MPLKSTEGENLLLCLTYVLTKNANFKKNTQISTFLDQPWPTQIGSRATFLNNRHFEGQNLDFSKDLIDLAPKYRFSEGRIGEFQGPHAARGPRVGHGCSRQNMIPFICFFTKPRKYFCSGWNFDEKKTNFFYYAKAERHRTSQTHSTQT